MSKQQIIVVCGAVVLIVLIFAAPRVPTIEDGPETSALAADVARAVSLVQNGDNPMEGIMLLRNVLERDSNFVEAHWQLGLMSIESGQFDKAVGRFRKVIELSPEEYSDAYLMLGKSLMSLGKKEEAIIVFESYAENLDDEKAKAALEAAISDLKKDISN